jgi:DNA polymerase-1
MIERVIALDFEYTSDHRPFCMVAREIGAEPSWRLWEAELTGLLRPPFDMGRSTALLAYYASAEMRCFLSLGWPMPYHLLDAHAEFRWLLNGRPPEAGFGLVGALTHFGLASIAIDLKEEMQTRALRGAPWLPGEPEAMLGYCQSDVDGLCALWPHLSRRCGWLR